MTEIGQQEHMEYLMEEYLSIHEAAELLEVSEDELRDLASHHKIPTHNIAGVFQRFKKNDIEELKNKWRIERELFPKKDKYFVHRTTVRPPSILERVRDLWYFNDFYLICSLCILALLYLIVTGQ